jgi:hypothetical protein
MKFIKQIVCFFFAALVLFSSSYLMIGFHMCGDHVQNVALFSKADGCAMEKKMPPCHSLESKPCCEDKTFSHDIQNYNASFSKMGIAPTFVYLVQSVVVPISEIIPSTCSHNKSFDYHSLIRARDITVTHQVFRI